MSAKKHTHHLGDRECPCGKPGFRLTGGNDVVCERCDEIEKRMAYESSAVADNHVRINAMKRAYAAKRAAIDTWFSE